MAANIEQCAGAVVMVGFRGLSADPPTDIHRQVRDLHLGGVILFDRDVVAGAPRNIQDPQQLQDLTAGIRAAGGDRVLIAVDQEGGKVCRLHPGNGFVQFPSHAEMGEKFDAAETRMVSAAMARVLSSCGINVNFAPVVDCRSNPRSAIIAQAGRSFSEDPGAVADHARAFLMGHGDGGVIPALKHFPGHGSAAGDTHCGAVDISATFREAELQPYRQLIAERLVKMVMVGHVLHRDTDAEYPASLSRRWIQGVLRDRLGFDGVVVTDDLDMAAVAAQLSLRQRVVLALGAGADVLLFGNNLVHQPDLPERVIEIILDAVGTGEVSPERLEHSARRVRNLLPAG